MYYGFISFMLKSMAVFLLCLYICNVYSRLNIITMHELTTFVASSTYSTMLISEFYFGYPISGFEFVMIQTFYWYIFSKFYDLFVG
jgi:hypothetical protein